MNGTTQPSHRPSLGLAIASLVLGILAAVLGIFFIGALFGLVGLVLGIVHLRRAGAPKGMAVTGVVLSIIGVVIAGAMIPIYIKTFKAVKAGMENAMKNASKPDEWVGVSAPDFTVVALDGTKITLSELKGKRVVLDFWATWCGPCVMEIPHFIEMRKAITPEELVIVGISQENADTLKRFVAKKGMNYPVASGRDLPLPYSGVTSIPTTFFIDRNGIIQNAVVGYHDLATLKQYATGKDYEGEPKAPPQPKSPPPSS